MFKKTIEYTDYNGESRKEDFYFNYTKTELVEVETSKLGGFKSYLETLLSSKDNPEIMKVMKQLILGAYGEKSPDGKRFVKSPEISEAFSQTDAYDKMFWEMCVDAEKAADFINAIVPQDLTEEVAKMSENASNVIPMPTDNS